MSKFAHLSVTVPCPSCGTDLAANDRVGFQWGYCAYPYSDRGRGGYRLGDALLWRVDVLGRVPAWRYFDDNTANVGDPRDGDVLVRECEFDIRECVRCRWAFGGIGVAIRAGRFVAVAAYPEWPSGADTLVAGPDRGWIPRPDWADRAMGYGARGGPHARLLETSVARTVADLV